MCPSMAEKGVGPWVTLHSALNSSTTSSTKPNWPGLTKAGTSCSRVVWCWATTTRQQRPFGRPRESTRPAPSSFSSATLIPRAPRRPSTQEYVLPRLATGAGRSYVARASGIRDVLLTTGVRVRNNHAVTTVQPDEAPPYTAIWDTGATGTVITSAVASECGLTPVGQCRVFNASGESRIENLYLVDVHLTDGETDMVVIQEVSVTETPSLVGGEILIGMDIIGMGDFAVSNLSRQDGVHVPHSIAGRDRLHSYVRCRTPRCTQGRSKRRPVPVRQRQ